MKNFATILLLCISIPVFSARYLVQSGNPGTPVWSESAKQGHTLIELSGANFNAWFNNLTIEAGNEVWLISGTYELSGAILLKDQVSLFGGFAGTETETVQRSLITNGKPWDFEHPTIFNPAAEMNNSCFSTVIAATEQTFFDGFTIGNFNTVVTTGTVGGSIGVLYGNWVMQNCKAHDNSVSATGNSVLRGNLGIYGGAEVINSYFYNNNVNVSGHNTKVGGAIFMYGNEASLILSCTFENNQAGTNGGAIFTVHTSGYDGGGLIEDCLFIGNIAQGRGGAVAIAQNISSNPNPIKINNCHFFNNQATGNFGGAVAFYPGTGLSAETSMITNCTFNYNSSPTGGALYISAPSDNIIVEACIFKDNQATGAGAAISVPTVMQLRLQNSIIANNTSSGPVVSIVGGTDNLVYNNTIVNNLNSLEGSVLLTGGLSSELKNTLFFGNNGTREGSILTAEYNAYDVAVPDGDVYSLTGITAASFINPTAFAGVPVNETDSLASAASNWQTTLTSPAVNSGADLSHFGVATDILGEARPLGAAFDIGAFEVLVTGIKHSTQSKLNVFPIATTDFINVEREVKSIRIYDLNGRAVENWKNTNRIDISHMSCGIYILKLKDFDGSTMNYKIIKK
jgi:predicted outer membrane repeat protein